MAATERLFIKRDYTAVCLSHFSIDVMNNGRNLLIAILAISLGLTNTHVGLVLLFYNIGNAISQPFFGLLADRIGVRWLIVGGVAWMIGFYTVASLASDWVALIATTIASLGSGMFHPSGTKVATQIPQPYRNRATAIFFLSGQMGLFAGPVIAGVLLDVYGRIGFVGLPILAFLALLAGWQWIHDAPLGEQEKQEETAVVHLPQNRVGQRGLALILIIIGNYTANITLITFLPKLFTELNFRPGLVGFLSGIFLLGGAVGGVVGGILGDKFSNKQIIGYSMAGSILPLYLIFAFSGAYQTIALFIAGFFTGIPHALLVLMAQSLFPKKKGMASGLVLGSMFFIGSVGSTLLGLLADSVGLQTVLANLGLLTLLSAIASLLLPADSAQKDGIMS